MSRRPRLLLAALLALVTAAAVGVAAPAEAAVAPPAEYGAAWDDPRTPEPPVTVPTTRHCTTRIVDHAFDDFSVATRAYTPPAACRGPWAKVVLRLDGSVAGRQYDRLGYVDIGGVRALTLSTPEPSETGVSWHVEKDVTDLGPLLRSPQQVQAFIGNVVDSTYTGVFDVTVDLDLYPGSPDASVPDQVLPLADPTRDGTDLVGSITLPRNTIRLLADVHATGSGGGCEEFWDTSAPASTGYSCADGLPYREVDVSIDGRLAGIAAPYPVVYTGGWSNPFLWYTTPSPHAFDIPTLGYDLTPFVGSLTDGRPHTVRISVVGLPDGQSGWTLSPRFSLWRDTSPGRVTGTTSAYAVSPPRLTSRVEGANDEAGTVDLGATRTFRATGRLTTSTGTRLTTVERGLRNTSIHTWTDGEADDVLSARWDDTQTVTRSTQVSPGTVVVDSTSVDSHRWSKQGTLGFHPHAGIPGAYDVTGDLTMTWAEGTRTTVGSVVALDEQATDRYSGTASWIYGVDRDQRHAQADTTTRSTLTRTDGTTAGGDTSYDRRLRSVNGRFVTDVTTTQ